MKANELLKELNNNLKDEEPAPKPAVDPNVAIDKLSNTINSYFEHQMEQNKDEQPK